MAILSILHYPDPRLQTVAAPVAVVDARVRGIVNDMFETMYHAEGIGLAATQVNIHSMLARQPDNLALAKYAQVAEVLCQQSFSTSAAATSTPLGIMNPRVLVSSPT